MCWSTGMCAYDTYLFLDSKSCSFAEACKGICIFAARSQGQGPQRDFVCTHWQRVLANDSRSSRNGFPFRRRHWELNEVTLRDRNPAKCYCVLSLPNQNAANLLGHVRPTLACLDLSCEACMMSTQLESRGKSSPYSAWAQLCIIAVQELQTRIKEGNAFIELCCRLFASALGPVLAFEQAVNDAGCVVRNLKEFMVLYSSLSSAVELAIQWVHVC